MSPVLSYVPYRQVRALTSWAVSGARRGEHARLTALWGPRALGAGSARGTHGCRAPHPAGPPPRGPPTSAGPTRAGPPTPRDPHPRGTLRRRRAPHLRGTPSHPRDPPPPRDPSHPRDPPPPRDPPHLHGTPTSAGPPHTRGSPTAAGPPNPAGPPTAARSPRPPDPPYAPPGRALPCCAHLLLISRRAPPTPAAGRRLSRAAQGGTINDQDFCCGWW